MKQKYINKLTVYLVVVSLISLFCFSPIANQALAVDAIKDAGDRISDSDLGVTALHTFFYNTNFDPGAGGYIEFTFPGEFGAIAANGDITCAGGGAASGETTRVARCTYAGGLAAGYATTTIANITNPVTANEYVIHIVSYDSVGTILERVQVMVAIIEDVWMTATVNANLNFVIAGMDAGEVVNGVTCNATTTATTTPFGTLLTIASTTVCQELTVSTNADDGYTVTVWASDELTSDSGSNINSFDNSPDNTGSTTAHAWTAPSGILDVYNTYGHMGLTSEDATLSTGDTFGASLYKGFNATDPIEVMYHDGPSDLITPDKGLTQVAYTAEITPLQEAGDYETTLTYICTPVY